DDINEEIRKVQEVLGPYVPGTLVKTGRGYQLYCSSGAFDIRNDHQKRLSDKVDIKGAGGYVVGPGSIHPNGAHYEFCDANTLRTGIILTKLSDAALHYIVSLQGSGKRDDPASNTDLSEGDGDRRASPQNALSYIKPIPEGQRNDTLFKIGCHYRELNGLQANSIYAILKEINSNDCDIPLNDAEVKAIAESCCKYPKGELPSLVELSMPDECSEEVLDLFQNNRLISLFRQNGQKIHVGDEAVIELPMLAVASMSVANTNGIHPKPSGDSGMGKTHGTKTALHLMHPAIYRIASFSSKALFYDKTLRPKMLIFSDDVDLAPDVEETVRAAMTNWNSPTEHITLDSKRNSITLSLPPRMVFLFTSVSNKSTIQMQNRQVEVNVDESLDQDKRVEELQRRLAELGLPEFYVDSEVELLREAFLHLNQVDFCVKIPFIRNIKFTNVHNRRNLPIFLDLIKAYCVLNYRARDVDEAGALVAVKEDFDNALELFKTVAVQQVTKLNEREREIAAVIKEHSPCDVYTILDETGLSRSRVSEYLHGDKDSRNKGMLEKIPELRYYSRYDYDEHGTRWGKNHYSLPENWMTATSHESIVYWDDNVVDEDGVAENSDLLRSVSDCFDGQSRNSLQGMGGLDGDLDPGLEDCLSNPTSYFGTSVEREPTPNVCGSAPSTTPVRNTETATDPRTDTTVKDSIEQIDPQIGNHSVSETQSEAARNATEAAEVRQDVAGALDRTIERAVTAIEITHRGQHVDPDLLKAYVVNEVQKVNSSYERETIKERFLELAKRDEKVGHIVDLITRGDFPL
ncbi:MAG: primase C-terminal domain-containing protein, partial [Halobacteriota archaeon]